MKQTFKVLNIKCEGCANSIKKSLLKDFGEVEVNLEVMPREISLEIENDNIDNLKAKLKSLGYPFGDEDLNSLEKFSTTTKSFVSCAIGKMGS